LLQEHVALKLILAILVAAALIAVVGRICLTGLRRFIRTLWPHS
jgi:hypothetical protein